VFSQPTQTQYRTPDFTIPRSGLTRELRGELSWLHAGLQLAGYYGLGWRPGGVYGPPDALQEVPDQGRFQRWGGRAGYDYKLGIGAWLHGEAGWAGGKGFDRFKSLSIGGIGGDVRIAGIRSNAITADQLAYAKAGVVLPSGPNLRLSFSLDHAEVRSLDDQKTRNFTGLGVAGDLPGFWVFTSVRMDLGMGVLSDMPGVRTVNGFVALLRVF
jgi:hemolysin activation/secretion protein